MGSVSGGSFHCAVQHQETKKSEHTSTLCRGCVGIFLPVFTIHSCDPRYCQRSSTVPPYRLIRPSNTQDKKPLPVRTTKVKPSSKQPRIQERSCTKAYEAQQMLLNESNICRLRKQALLINTHIQMEKKKKMFSVIII